MGNRRVLVDSDVFFGLMFEQDAHHATVSRLWRELREQRTQPLTTNLVIGETATVLSRRLGQEKAHQFLRIVADITTITITEHLHLLTVDLFSQQTRPKTSFVDMSNVVVSRELGLSEIFSFDAVYKKDFGLELAA